MPGECDSLQEQGSRLQNGRKSSLERCKIARYDEPRPGCASPLCVLHAMKGKAVSTVPQRYRLVTRSDFDGLVCAVLLKHLDLIDDILFVHPKDMQDGKIAISPRDITTNLPYVAAAHLAFDHHLSETIRNTGRRENHIIHPEAPSAARVVYDHYGGARTFPPAWEEMMAAVDKG